MPRVKAIKQWVGLFVGNTTPPPSTVIILELAGCTVNVEYWSICIKLLFTSLSFT